MSGGSVAASAERSLHRGPLGRQQGCAVLGHHTDTPIDALRRRQDLGNLSVGWPSSLYLERLEALEPSSPGPELRQSLVYRIRQCDEFLEAFDREIEERVGSRDQLDAHRIVRVRHVLP